MKLYFAGAEVVKDFSLIKSTLPPPHRMLFSVYSLGYHKTLPNQTSHDDWLIDSGGFSALKAGFDIDVGDYIGFLNRNSVKVAFNLDVPSHTQTLANQRRLEAETQAYILPIYHLSDFYQRRDWLDDLIRDYTYIALGGTAFAGVKRTDKKALFDYTFHKTRDKIKVHGLGVNDANIMTQYPFYSVDSTAWINARKYGKRFQTDGIGYNIKDSQDAHLNSFPQKIGHYSVGCANALKVLHQTEANITRLWEKRGVVWRD